MQTSGGAKGAGPAIPLRCAPRPHEPRRPEDGVLHRVLHEHLETFLEETRAAGNGLPGFVEREIREFLSCGILARGFARFRCDECGHEILVAFSCKGRGFCPSCCGRRMADLAAHLTDDVLGGLPVRQWVLTLPHRLRYVLAWDHKLCRAVLGVFIRALLTFERRRAEWRGFRGARGGAVTAIQRFGSALNLNIHFHTLAVQGVFVDDASGGLRFVPNPELSDLEVAKLLTSISWRITRLAKRHGIDLEHTSEGEDGIDSLANESSLLAGICGASVLGRIATGRRAGQPVLRVGRHRGAPLVTLGGERQAHVGGFDLHANVAVPAGDRCRLEHLARYVLRPPV
ncbi:MAG: transposase zinc-binding domain-containing protein, partial [Deltaproteobacteria bacterium]|nr:transposase zinc-binding domain-containing protein [Deltaproteobacteria bacterium]